MLLLKTWRDLNARKAQFGALIILIALGISSYIAFISGYQNLSASNDLAKTKLRFADFSTGVTRAPKGIVARLAHVPGVRAVQGRLILDTGLELTDDEQVTCRVIGIPRDSRPAVNDILVEEGSYFKSKAKEQGLINRRFALDVGIKVGDSLKLIIDGEKHDIHIQGIVSSPEYMVAIRGKGEIPSPGEFAVIFMAQNEVERLFKTPPMFNDFSFLVKLNANREEAIVKAEDILDPYSISETVKQEEQPSNFTVLEEIRQNQSFAYLMPLVILMIAAMSLFIALSRLVQSQRGEIGLAKALGYSNGQILLHYLLFSVIIGIGGSVVGFGLGQLFAIGITQMYVEQVGIPFLRNRIYPEQIVTAIGLSVSFCLAAGLIPAYASARIAPARAMHADPTLSMARGATPWLERLLSRFFALPLLWRIPLRNVFRARRRSLYTIIGIAFALLLTIATWSSFDSIDYLMTRQFEEVETWDMLAVFNRGFDRSRLGRIASWDGVRRVQPALQIPIKLKTEDMEHEMAVTAISPSASFHGFDIAEGPRPDQALRSGGIIMPMFLMTKLGLALGDSVTVSTPVVKDREVSLRIVAVNQEMVGTPAYISIELGRKLIRAHGDIFNTVYIDANPERAAEIKRKLYDLPGAMQVIIKQSLVEKLQELMKLSYSMFAILLAFAFTMAFVVVYNTFTANILERTREIATMRTIGEDRWHLALMITIENLMLALAGIPLGIWFGVRTAHALFASFSSESFSLTAHIYLKSFFWIIGSILVVLLISEIPSIRRVFKLDLAEATKVIE